MRSQCKIPGFVDIQVNGYGGTSFSDPDVTKEKLSNAIKAYLNSAAVAAFCPTVVTSTMETYEIVLPLLADLIENSEHKDRLLGIHAEGPFISPKDGAVGAHNKQAVRSADIAFFDRMQELAKGHIIILTLAAESEGSVELTQHCSSKGVIVSVGHQLATPDDIARVVKAGATMATHVGNGLPNMIHRHQNPLWPILAEDKINAGVISDGFHLPVPLIKTIIRAKGVEKAFIVSDVSAYGGCKPGAYKRAGDHSFEVVLEPSGKLHVPSRQCLAGSGSNMLQCLNFLHSTKDVTGFSLDDMLQLSFYNPLRAIRATSEQIKALECRVTEKLFYDDKAGFSYEHSL
eukprot:m.94487 g.94487  ORF g.94487 m.94487 type:complete len:345 (+) comp13446_c0_seq3:146-1180(+)